MVENRERVLQRDDFTCQRCGATGGDEREHDLQVHHVIPRAEGGSDELENLVTLCKVCHNEVHTGVTQEEVAQVTGRTFWNWIDDYEGEEKSPWTSEYTCVRCGHRWAGKPLSERESSTVNCPNTNCVASGRVSIEVGELYIPIATIRSLRKSDNTLNYTGVEFMTPDIDFTSTPFVEYESEHLEIIPSYTVYVETRAECEKCGDEGAKRHYPEIGGDLLNQPQSSEMVLCDDCKGILEQNDSIQFD